MVVELVPFVSVFCNCSVVSRLQLAEVIADREQVVDWLLILLEVTHNVVTHVKTLRRKLHKHVLLRVIASESFEVDYQNRWYVVELDLLHGLLVLDTLVAVPSVCLTEIFWLVELAEAVMNANIVSIFLLVAGLELALLVADGSIQHRV